jgi:pimeloyl-ACP methyl ester carboxylesterase
MRVAADAVAEFICGEFADQSVHIFGNSMGGAVCVQLAAHHPELVRSITLVSPAMPELRPRLASIHMPVTAVPGVGERLVRHSMLRQAEERVRASMEMCYAQIGRIHPDRWVEQVAEATQRETLAHAPTAVLGSLRALVSTYFDRSDERPWQLAGRIDVPVVLVYGRLDKLVNSRAAHRATREFKNARVVVVPDSGHVSQMEHPEIVADAWRELAR